VQLGRVASGHNPSEERNLDHQAMTVKELCRRYLADLDAGLILGKQGRPKKASTISTDTGQINHHIIPLLGTRRVEGIKAHVLRHSFASIANDLGFAEVTIAALIGHSKGTVTSKYIHTLDTALVMAAIRSPATFRDSSAGLSSSRPPTRLIVLPERRRWRVFCARRSASGTGRRAMMNPWWPETLNVSQLRDILPSRRLAMAARTSMLHVRVDDDLKARASETLANVGLTVSDAVRILLTRVAKEGGLPASLTADAAAHDAWFRAKVQEALDDPRPTVPHAQVMDEVQALIDRKLRVQSEA
jgi:DNA-damage-inducible protein J